MIARGGCVFADLAIFVACSGFVWQKMNACLDGNGVVAQLVERLVRNEKVAGSIPVGSTTQCLQGFLTNKHQVRKRSKNTSLRVTRVYKLRTVFA